MQVRRCSHAGPATVYPVNVMWRDVYVAGTNVCATPQKPVRRSAGTSLAWLRVTCEASCYGVQSRVAGAQRIHAAI